MQRILMRFSTIVRGIYEKGYIIEPHTNPGRVASYTYITLLLHKGQTDSDFLLYYVPSDLQILDVLLSEF